MVVATVLVVTVLFLASRSSILHARSVRVGGTEELTRAEVLAVSGLSRETNVLWLDEGAVERRLEAEPWVEDATVRVEFPWTLEIAIRERVAVAVAGDGIRELLLAADGTVLGTGAGDRGLVPIEIPSTVAAEQADAFAAGAATVVGAMSQDLRERVGSVIVTADGIIELRLEGGVTVSYGVASRVDRKADALAWILAWSEETGERLSTVSVVAPELPAVKVAG